MISVSEAFDGLFIAVGATSEYPATVPQSMNNEVRVSLTTVTAVPQS